LGDREEAVEEAQDLGLRGRERQGGWPPLRRCLAVTRALESPLRVATVRSSSAPSGNTQILVSAQGMIDDIISYVENKCIFMLHFQVFS
jgi:hypothetical protein